jgi:hypothetical protein
MTDGKDLEKLFEAALNEKQAPSRFGTPESQMKSAPAAFLRPAPGGASAFTAAPPVSQPSASAFQAAPSAFLAAAPLVQRDALGDASLDQTINAELAAIMDAKIAKDKRRRRLGFLFTVLFFVGVTGGATGWVLVNPERYAAMKAVLAEIKSVGDIQGIVAKYQKSLDKIAERGKQIDSATVAMGVDPTSVDEHEDPGFDNEMKAMMGEEGGKTSAARDKLLRNKFKSVEETGSLIPNKDEAKETEE